MDRSDDSCIYVSSGIGAVNNCATFSWPKEKNYDRVKALEESKRLLDLISTPNLNKLHNTPLHGNLVLSSCYFCKMLMPLTCDRQCKLCSENFCNKHKSELDHNCEKLSKDTAKYLNAKNQFKLKLREAKSKAVR